MVLFTGMFFVFLIVLGSLSPSSPEKPAAADQPPPLSGLTPQQHSRRLVTIQATPFPPLPPETVRSSIAIYGRGLRLVRAFGDTPALARGYGFLATLHAAVEEYDEAERLFRQARRILKKRADSQRDLAWIHNNHGLVQMSRGRYLDALRSFSEAVAQRAPKRSVRQWHVVALQNLASTHVILGNPDAAERAYLESLDVLASLGDEGSRPHQIARSNLAIFYAHIGDLDSARALLEKLVTERGLDRMTRFQVLSNLGHVLSTQREFAKAETRFQQAQSLTPPRSSGRAAILTNRTMMYRRAGQLDRAAETGEQARTLVNALYGEDSTAAGAILTELGVIAMRRGETATAERLLGRAFEIFQNQNDQPAQVIAARALALVAQRLGNDERAKALSRQALDLAKAHLDQILAFASEAQRLAYQSQAAPYDQLATFGEPNLLAEAVLAMKGAVLESLLAERSLARRSSPAEQAKLARINELKVQIMEKIGRGDRELETLERALKNEQSGLARQLASRLRASQVQADVPRIRAKLDADQVLVEIIRFEHYSENRELVNAYGAVVIPHKGTPRWVFLDSAPVIDNEIASLVGRFGGGRSMESAETDADVVALLRDLHGRVWLPLVKSFPPRTRQVLLSPDGATCFLPWAALLDEKQRFVAERWQLTQIGTGRDLLRDVTPSPAKTLLALGDGAGDLQYSRSEVEYAGATARRNGWTATILLNERASERQLFQHPRPGILHLATHAGRLPAGTARVIQTRLSRNPMYRGYLVLGGGHRTLRDWGEGRSVPFAIDGILTAEEASALDLRDTWLTVLSACETGAGDVRAGEGVMGLRRGFALAGTQNLVLSLWPVDDQATAQFMTQFYDRLFGSANPSRAFHDAQVAELLRWKERNDLQTAVHLAGGFVLTR
jgi:tetratricopeptide (TPR) repeat protein